MAITPFLNLDLPTPTLTIGPVWAEMLNTALEVVDDHDHSSGKGKRIKTNGLQIDADLAFASFRATGVGALKLTNLGATLTGSTNSTSVYSVAGNLYFTNSAGSAVQITSGGSVVSSPASLTSVQSTNINTNLVISAADTFVYLLVDTTATRTITLPLSANLASGRIYIIKDKTGSSFTNPITVQVSGSDLIDGQSSVILNSSFSSTWLIADGVTNFSIS